MTAIILTAVVFLFLGLLLGSMSAHINNAKMGGMVSPQAIEDLNVGEGFVIVVKKRSSSNSSGGDAGILYEETMLRSEN